MFGFEEIQRECGIFLRDTNNTYEQELKLCWEEMLRNLPREYFSINLARDIPFTFRENQAVYEGGEIGHVQQIYSIRYKWGGIWMYLERVGMNETDIFTPEGDPRALPFFYEYAAGRLKVYPTPQRDLPAMLTASLGVWNPDGGCPADCVRISDKYKTFCRNYVLSLLNSNILRDEDGAAAMAAQLDNERQKLIAVRERETGTGIITPGW